MANFKLSKKNAVSDTRTNIVDLYDKKLEFFDEEKKNLKKYYIQLNSLQKELNTCDLQLKNKIQDNIKRLSEQIYNIENDVDRNQYLLDFVKYFSHNFKLFSEKLILIKIINEMKSEYHKEELKGYKVQNLEKWLNTPINKNCSYNARLFS